MRQLPSRLRRLDGALADLPLEEPMLLTELDGFLTGLLVGPEEVPQREWMEVVWGTDDGGTPPFDDPLDVRWFADAVQAHADGIARQLARGRLQPVFDVDERSGDVVWEAWLDGFADAVALRGEAWAALAEREAAIFARLDPLLAVAAGDSALDSVEINVLDEVAADEIVACVIALYAARGPATARSEAAPVAAPGRNDPCPCGSGIKFKRCCA